MARRRSRGGSAGWGESTDLSVLVEGDADVGPALTHVTREPRRRPTPAGWRHRDAVRASEPEYLADRSGAGGGAIGLGSAPATGAKHPARNGAVQRGRHVEVVGVAALAGVALLSLVLVLAGEIGSGRWSADRPQLRAPAGLRVPVEQPAPATAHSGGGGLAEALAFGGGSTPPVESMGAWRALRMVVRAEHSPKVGGTAQPERGSPAAMVGSGSEGSGSDGSGSQGGVAPAEPAGPVTVPGPPGAPAGRRVVLPAPFASGSSAVTSRSRVVASGSTASASGSRAVAPAPREGLTEPPG